MSRVLAALGLAIVVFVVYIALVGSLSLTDIVFAIIISVTVGAIGSSIAVEQGSKLFDIARLLRLAKYFVHYMTIIEVKAHIDMIKKILNPKAVRPAIVEVPYFLETEYGIMMVANSITNTPGTVVIDVDEEKKVMYVHWIDAKTFDPMEARKHVSKVFEEYARKIFE